MKGKFPLFFWAAAIAAFLIAAKTFHIQDLLRKSLYWIKDIGPWGPLLFIGVYILACLLFLPGWILTLGAGAIFGAIKGSVVVSIGATLGATCAFLAGRYLARGWVEERIRGNKKFMAIDEAVAKEGWKIVGLTRLSPVFPFNLLNYAYGVTQVSLKDFFLASWIGMLPGTVMYVYLGSVAGDVATLGNGPALGAGGAARWAIRIVGLIAAVAVTITVTRIAKKALEEKVSS